MIYYVSPQGSNTFPGTEDKPVQTPEKALELARTHVGNRTILLKEGLYEDVSLNLDERDSGLEIRGEGQAVLCGGRKISGWEKCGDSSYSAKLPSEIPADFRIITVNGSLRERARFPAEGRLEYRSRFDSKWMSTSMGGWDIKPTKEQLTTLEYDPADISPDFDWQNAELTVFHRWDDSMSGISAHEFDKNIFRLSAELTHPPGGFDTNTYIIWNTKEGMKPGKWRVDKLRGILYFSPFKDEDISQLDVFVPSHHTIINLQGEISKLTIDGLHFMLTSSPTTACGFGAINMPGALNSTAMLSDCVFKNLHFAGTSGWGISLVADNGHVTVMGDGTEKSAGEQGNKNVIVENCIIIDAGGGGIQLRGNTGCLIKDSKIKRAGRIYYSAAGIYASNCDIISNTLCDLPYSGITLAGGDRSLISGNRISGAVRLLNDGAGIYVTFSENGVLRDNYVENVPSEGRQSQRHGLYLDEQANGWIVEGNITVNCPSAILSHMNYREGNILRSNSFICHEGDMTLIFIRCLNHRLESNNFHTSGTLSFGGKKDAITHFEGNRIYSAIGQIKQINISDEYEWSEPVDFNGQNLF